MGTPEAAVPTLETLNEMFDVGLVVTQPDRPQGRSGTPVPPPIKTAATRLGLPTAQPESRPELADSLAGDDVFDLGVVVAYGRILPPQLLDRISAGFLNLHFSLLPRWRGAAPVARALLAGDAMTGVTIIRLDEGLDTGPVLTAQAVDMIEGENAGALTHRLARLGARLLASSIPPYLDGTTTPEPQSDEGLTHADKITAADRPLDPHSEVVRFINQVRALAPTPAATLDIDGTTHKILLARPTTSGPEPGNWALVEGRPVVGVADGWVELEVLQPPAKTPTSGESWARGRRADAGVVA